MNDKAMLDKSQFVKYAHALLKNHSVIINNDGSNPVHFPENSPTELLAHSVFSKKTSLLIICKNKHPIGTIEFQTKRSPTKDYKVIEILNMSDGIEDLTPTNLAHS